MGRKALKRQLGRNPTAAELDYDRVVKSTRRQATKTRKDWVRAQLSRPPQPQRAEKAFTAPALLSPGPAAPAVVKQLSGPEQAMVASLEARRARLARVAFDPAKDALLETQIARLRGVV